MAQNSVAQTADKLNTTEHYVRQLIKRFNLETLAQLPNPGGLKSVSTVDPITQRPRVMVEDEVIDAYLAKRASGVGRSVQSLDGRKSYKFRASEAELGLLRTTAGLEAVATSIKSGNNYNSQKSKAKRHQKAAERQKGDVVVA